MVEKHFRSHLGQSKIIPNLVIRDLAIRLAKLPIAVITIAFPDLSSVHKILSEETQSSTPWFRRIPTIRIDPYSDPDHDFSYFTTDLRHRKEVQLMWKLRTNHDFRLS